MRDTNVKMWMKFSFSERDVSDNEMDKKKYRKHKKWMRYRRKMRRNLHFFYI